MTDVFKDPIDELDDALNEKEKTIKEINELNAKLEEKKNKLKKLENKISHLCDHEFINDYIDTMYPYRESIPITYCDFCGLSQDVVNSYSY